MKKAKPFIALVILVVVAIFLRNCVSNKSNKKEVDENVKQRGLNRNPSNINYTKHAKCRMDCRHIDEKEVVYILENGKINYSKSDLKGKDCNKKYAVEGISKDKQKLRIVFAPCNNEVTVITCIDLDTEWECSCPGDE
ncbi:MAG TPA: DUF4258 domain-containing protein [Chitinophagaceae bacterium]|nr:DUF4258 domain-containing protein [Chitinophagaceae bacterium]MCC6635320.1 DUF4258 domain-containing protein [Chitinophagaceae bacterium]HMZ45824.1 DUF4258 domain-containing protein [Chitinophagaceae bacterium]HNE94263.1 DUF4258 domain-containing protein [Chitinophagaceae bacterium]HNF30129.1 DUF4258 domain-containing protein [Chitinophagaceae bacterium]